VRTDDNEIVILSPKYANEIRSDERLNFEENIHRVSKDPIDDQKSIAMLC
jgi:hypothetical protein